MSNVTATSYFEVLTDVDGQGHYLVKDVTKDQTTAIIDVHENAQNGSTPTTVISLDGRTIRRYNTFISTTDAISGLDKGIYVVNGKKIVVK